MRRRFVAQLSVMTGDAELFDQAKLGQQFGLTENDFGKNFLVKEVEAPRPKPDQVDQKNRQGDDREENDRKEPLQDALKHDLDQPVISPSVNQKFLRTKHARGGFPNKIEPYQMCPGIECFSANWPS